MSTTVTHNTDLPIADGDVSVTLHKPLLVAQGEYASEGQPDVLIHVVHAVDERGHDIRDTIAVLIAKLLDERAEATA